MRFHEVHHIMEKPAYQYPEFFKTETGANLLIVEDQVKEMRSTRREVERALLYDFERQKRRLGDIPKPTRLVEEKESQKLSLFFNELGILCTPDTYLDTLCEVGKTCYHEETLVQEGKPQAQTMDAMKRAGQDAIEKLKQKKLLFG